MTWFQAFASRPFDPDLAGRSYLRLAFLVLTLATWLLYYNHNFFSSFRIDDDSIYYTLTAQTVLNPADAAPVKQAFGEFLRTEVDDPALLKRNELRLAYTGNYPVMSALWGGVGRLAAVPDSATGDTPEPLQAYPYVLSFHAAGLVLGAIFIVIALLVPRIDISVGIAAAIATVALLSLLPAQLNRFTLTQSFLRDSLSFVFSMQDNFNIFNFSPRGVFSFLLIGVFAARWLRRYEISYAVLLLLCFIHQSNATMAALVLLGVDLLLRPRIFRHVPTGFLACGTVLLVLSREALFETAGWEKIAVLLLAMAALPVIGHLARAALQRRAGDFPGRSADRPISRAARRLSRLASHPGPATDITVISLGWLASLPVVFFLVHGQAIDEFSGRYVWWQLHARLGALLVPSVIMAVAIIMANAAPRAGALAAGAGLIVASLAILAPPAGPAAAIWPVTEKAAQAAVGLERVRNAALRWSEGRDAAPPSYASEPAWYYALAAAVDGDQAYLPPELRTLVTQGTATRASRAEIIGEPTSPDGR